MCVSPKTSSVCVWENEKECYLTGKVGVVAMVAVVVTLVPVDPVACELVPAAPHLRFLIIKNSND